MVVSHLQFANDAIFFLKPDGQSFISILTILGFFETISGFKINLAKSSLASINVDSQIMNAFTSLVGCQVIH